jgi:hypothetical protein
MAIDTTTPRSRRALLTAAVGGAAVAAAASLAKASPVGAADGDTVKVGEHHHGNGRTSFQKNTAGEAALWGGHVSDGFGVQGSSETGAGLLAYSHGGGHALRTLSGRIRFEQVSGVATIPKGSRSMVVSPGVPVNAQTFVLLTPMANIGSRALWFTKKPAANEIVIRMSSTRNAATKIAWLALERG